MWASLLILSTAFLVADVHAQSQCSGPPSARPHDCCPNMPRLVTAEIGQECGLPSPPSSGGAQERPAGPPMPIGCDASKCILNKFGLLSGDKVNRGAFPAFMNQRYGSEWRTAVDTAVQTCNGEVDANTSDCEPMQYYNCIKGNMVKNCPDSIWIQSSECAATKAFMQNCPMPRPGPMG